MPAFLPAFPSLTRGQVRQIARELRSKGRKLPRFGWCQRLDDGRELCHDPKGYFLVGEKRTR